MKHVSQNLTWQTITLHWLTAALFITTFAIGFYMVDLPRGEDKGLLISRHQSLGAILLFISFIRIAWRLKEGSISDKGDSNWQDLLAKITHFLLLCFTILMPISGLMMSISSGRGFNFFGNQVFILGEKNELLFTLASTTHHASVNWVVLFVALHVLGALKRQYIGHDNTLYRMFGKNQF